MTSRAEAITYLKSLGFEAEEHDWVLGETIQVCCDPDENFEGAYKRALNIYPRDGMWSIYDPFARYPRSDERRLSLQAACDAAVKLLQK